MTQYIVALFEDPTQNVTAVGPYQTKQRAEEEVKVFRRFEDKERPDSGLGAHVVELESGADVRKRIREAMQGYRDRNDKSYQWEF